MSTVGPAYATGDRAAPWTLLRLLWRDKFAFTAVVLLLVVAFCAIFGPMLLSESATRMNMRLRNAAPFSLEHGWLYFLGADPLGRSILARLIVASQNTIAIAGAAVILSMAVGGVLGLVAGFRGGWAGEIIMRLADILMSFPSLLLALIVLYVLEPRAANIVLVLAVARVSIYVRTARAEVLEVRERMYITAARAIGASPTRIVWRHVGPAVVPTLITIATLDFAFVMLSEASLSFLGLGMQPPDITWGLMVAEGRNYLGTAWWLAFWPGLAITLTTLALNFVASWMRVVNDPMQRARLEMPARQNV